MTGIARVLLDAPLPQLDRLFDYAVPDALDDGVAPGVRVKVPLRSAGRMLEGFVVERLPDEPAVGADGARPLSAVDAVVSPVPVLTPALYDLARRAADRAAGSAADILRLVIPKRMVRAEKTWLAAGTPDAPAPSDDAVAWATAQLDVYDRLGEALAAGERAALLAPPRPAATVDDGSAPFGAWAELLCAIAVERLAAGRSTILVVPDHRDQSELTAALESRLPAPALVRVDARQSGPARYGAYLRMLQPVPCVVVGNRSSVYAPAHDVGAVVVWDDGDPLLAEPLSPGVHARDAALLRQEREQSALVFAGHSRTSDVERLVQLGWVRDVAAARPLKPTVVLPKLRDGEHSARIPSSAYAAARAGLEDGPVLVQVARPGYAPVLVCAQCRTPTRCPACAGPLRARRAGAAPDCAWCGRRFPAWQCRECASTRLRMASSGSERTADELGRAFPNVRVIVSDGEHQVAHVEAAPALVIATRGAEPIARGGYRAVLLLDGDRMLLTEQLRIGESCLRWWSRAAALAAPGAPVHLVGVDGPLARAFATWTSASYARAELADRAPLRMPPTVRVAALEGRAGAVGAALTTLRADVPALPADAVLGPVPTGDDTVRALVRFDYGLGKGVAGSLRASVVAAALRTRRRKGDARGPQTPRTTLTVRLDVPELDL